MSKTRDAFRSPGTDEATRRIERFIEEYGFEDPTTTDSSASIRRLALKAGGDAPGKRERPPHADHDELVLADVGGTYRKPVAYVNHVYGHHDDDGAVFLPDAYVEDFEAFAERWGLSVDVRPDLSWYEPGGTVAVIYTIRGDDE